jgi:hypothetical protein
VGLEKDEFKTEKSNIIPPEKRQDNMEVYSQRTTTDDN